MEDQQQANIDDLCRCRCIHEDRVSLARKSALSDTENSHLSHFFKALGDPSRLQILWALEKGEMCVCDLAAFIGISESAVSHQLRLLRQLQIVVNRRDGAVLYYRLNNGYVSSLLQDTLKNLNR